MKAQLDLIGRPTPPEPQPAPDRRDPVVWISRLSIMRKLDPAPEHLIRDIRLRRGLNIIWTPPAASQAGGLFGPGLAGHTAGKTTFCRFLRYVLGEPHFASERITGAIRERIPEGWIVAEVVVAGATWTVGRPFSIGTHPFASRGAGVQEILAGQADRGEYRTYLNALSDATVAALPARRLSGTATLIDWPHLLPWLTRDQECHFAQFHEWRDPSTKSDLPALSADDRHYLLRAVLGLVSDEEADEQARHASLLTDRRMASQDVAYLERQTATEHQRLRDALGVDVSVSETDLFGWVPGDELNRRRAAVTERMKQVTDRDRRQLARDALERAVAAEANAARDVTDFEGRLALEQGAVEQLRGSARAASSQGVLMSLPRVRDFCQVPLAVARERGCPLAGIGVSDLTERIASRSVADDISHHTRIVQEVQTMLKDRRAILESLEQATAAARNEFVEAQAEYDTIREEALAARADLQHAEWLVRTAAEAARQLVAQSEKIAMSDVEIDASRERQETLRRADEASLRHASSRFEYVVQAILGSEIEASLRLGGRDLALHISRDGERESAAMSTVRVLAFDLGAMTASIEGIGSFPRFLVHDCPRESDLAPDVYERLFLLARHLEERCEGEPPFQYILTTTTPPPTAFQADPWLRLQLAGTPSDGRLLRLDL